MKQKRFPIKLMLALVLVAMCQLWIVVLPVHGLAWEVTTWVTDGGSYGRGSDLDPGDKWSVWWNVTKGGDGKVDVVIEDPSAVLLYTQTDSTGGSYIVTATTNGTYYAHFNNPADDGQQIQVHIITENLGPGVPGFNFILVISLLGLLILFAYRKTKMIKI